MAKKRIEVLLEQSNTQTLTITYNDLDLNLFSGNMTLSDVNIIGQDRKGSFQLGLNTLKVRGVNVLKYLLDSELHVNRVVIDSPQLHYLISSDTTNIIAAPADQSKLPEVFVKNIVLRNGSFKLTEKKTAESQRMKGDFDITLHNIHLPSPMPEAFNLEDINISLQHLEYLFPDSLYKLSIRTLAYSLGKQSLSIDSMHLLSLHKKHELGQIVGREIDWLDIHTSSISTTGINLKELLFDSLLQVECLAFKNGEVVIFRDKRLPEPHKGDTQLLHQLLADIPLPFSVDTIKMQNMNISYQEFVKSNQGPGVVTFNELYATGYNFTNIDSIAERVKATAHLDARTKVMGRGLLNVSFSFPLAGNSLPYSVSGSMDDMDLTAFNSMIEYVDHFKIKTGHLRDLTFRFNYDLHRSAGTMKFKYQNLKIEALNQETNDPNGLGVDIKSFIANTFVIKNNNYEENGNFREGEISFERNKQKSMFNYWWKSLLTGFKSSAGIPPAGDKNLKEKKKV